MAIQLSRRKLCGLAAGAPVFLPVFGLAAARTGKDVLFRVDNSHADPVIRRGSMLIVDTTISGFAGDGLYIYPDWGNPVVYEVTCGNNGYLEFRYPGKQNLLWRMRQDASLAVFSGKATACLAPDEAARAVQLFMMSELQVPVLPA